MNDIDNVRRFLYVVDYSGWSMLVHYEIDRALYKSQQSQATALCWQYLKHRVSLKCPQWQTSSWFISCCFRHYSVINACWDDRLARNATWRTPVQLDEKISSTNNVEQQPVCPFVRVFVRPSVRQR